MKNIITEWKNATEGFKWQIRSCERISKVKVEFIQSEEQKEKSKYSIRDL